MVACLPIARLRIDAISLTVSIAGIRMDLVERFPPHSRHTDRCFLQAMSYSPNMKRKQARLSDTAGGLCPKGSRALAYAAQLATVAPNDTIDPNVINGPDFSDFVSRFLSGTTISEHAAGYSCVTQPTAQPDQLYLGWNGKVALWSAKATVNFAAYAGGFSTSDHALYAGMYFVGPRSAMLDRST